MTADLLLLIVIIGLPLLGALYLIVIKPFQSRTQQRIATIILLVAVLSSIARFILTGQVRCTFTAGQESCLQIGLLALSVILLNGLSLYLSLSRRANRLPDYQFYTLFNAAWGGAALVDNWVISLGSLSLALIAISRWIWNRGASVGIFVGRDDYKDDIGPAP